MKSVHFNARIPRELSDRLRRYAGRRRLSTSAAAVELLDEALRAEMFPGIDFRWSAIGRQPFVTGTGLSVWELFHFWGDHGRSARRLLRNHPHLTAVQVQAALGYAEAFPRDEPPGAWGRRPPFARPVRV